MTVSKNPTPVHVYTARSTLTRTRGQEESKVTFHGPLSWMTLKTSIKIGINFHHWSNTKGFGSLDNRLMIDVPNCLTQTSLANFNSNPMHGIERRIRCISNICHCAFNTVHKLFIFPISHNYLQRNALLPEDNKNV